MRLELYQAECERIARDQLFLLTEARARLESSQPLSRLEQAGVLHALQTLVENAIGKAKHLLKQSGQAVPVSAYDSFAALEREGLISCQELPQWNAAIGLRNRIVHDYMNIDIERIYTQIQSELPLKIAEFLRQPIPGVN